MALNTNPLKRSSKESNNTNNTSLNRWRSTNRRVKASAHFFEGELVRCLRQLVRNHVLHFCGRCEKCPSFGVEQEGEEESTSAGGNKCSSSLFSPPASLTLDVIMASLPFFVQSICGLSLSINVTCTWHALTSSYLVPLDVRVFHLWQWDFG